MATISIYSIIIALGICSSYTDIKFQKIKNLHIFFATFSGLIIYAYLIINHIIPCDINLLFNFLVSVGIGFLLYYTDIWGAGDAKLFIVYCLLMPTGKHFAILPFSSIIIFMNIFLFGMLAILILSIGKIIENKYLLFKKIFSLETLSKLGNSFLIVFGLGWIIQTLINPSKPYSNPLLIILILYFSYLLLYKIVNKLKNNHLIFVILAAGLVSRFMFQTIDFTFSNLLLYFKKAFFYTLIFYILNIIFNLNKAEGEKKRRIPFAPFMFLGTLASNTDFIYWFTRILDSFKR